MHRLISRQEAAQILGVDPQTISNYINQGILRKHLINGKVFVDRNTINSLFDDLTQIGQSKEKIKELKEEIKKQEDTLNNRLSEINLLMVDMVPHVRERYFPYIFEIIINMVGRDILDNREIIVLTKLFCEKKDTAHVGELCSVSNNTAGKIANAALGKIERVLKNYSFYKNECESLRGENLRLQNSVQLLIDDFDKQEGEKFFSDNINEILIEKYGGIERVRIIRDVLKTRVVDWDLSFRSLNCLRAADVETVGDLVRCNKSDLLNMRNFGKVSLIEIENFLHQAGLELGMDITEILQINL